MPGDERKHAKIISFADNYSRPFGRPLDGATLAETRRHFQEIALRIQGRRAENGDGQRTFEFTTLKNRAAPAPIMKILPESRSNHMHHFYGEYERSCVFCKNEIAAERSKPTAWEHLLRDEGLG